MAMIRQRVCRWCTGLSNDPLETSCTSCGGPLPTLSAKLLRENPELIVTDADFAAIMPGKRPRTLPAGYFSRHLLWRNFGFLWGSIWIGIGCLFCVISVPMLVVFLLLGVIFFFVSLLVLAIGFAATFAGMVHPWRRLMALRSGLHAQGTVVDVRTDHNNETHITYVFETPDGVHEGTAQTEDWLAAQREEGERVWIVYREHDPDQNALWPPL